MNTTSNVTSNCPIPGQAGDINEGDTAWMIVASALVLLMTPGLAFFYGGMVRQKNVVNTLMMSYTALGIVMLQWVFFGYSFAFGPGNEGFGSFKWGGFYSVGSIPNSDYAATIPHLAFANYQMMFAVITPALISGAIVERMNFKSYVIFIFVWTTVVYDPLAHWMWSAYSKYDDDGNCEYVVGWLRNLGAIDFAGGTVIHISSGFSGLVASYIVGRRAGVSSKTVMPPHNIPFVLLGAGILWFGWLGFNGGSSLASNGPAALAATNTSIAAAASFITWLVLDTVVAKRPSAVGAATGAVIGLVAITPASGFVLPGWSIMIGFLSTTICYFVIRYKHFFKVDDALDCFFCHGVGGVCGSLMTGLWATKGANEFGVDGAFYGRGYLFGAQLLAVVITICLSSVGTAAILLALKYTIGLRTHETLEEDGMDLATHKEKGFRIVAFEEEDDEGIRGLRKVLTRGSSLLNSKKSSKAPTPKSDDALELAQPKDIETREVAVVISPSASTNSASDLVSKETNSSTYPPAGDAEEERRARKERKETRRKRKEAKRLQKEQEEQEAAAPKSKEEEESD